jgi:hypothetical protein
MSDIICTRCNHKATDGLHKATNTHGRIIAWVCRGCVGEIRVKVEKVSNLHGWSLGCFESAPDHHTEQEIHDYLKQRLGRFVHSRD